MCCVLFSNTGAGAILHDKPSDPTDPKTFPFVGSTVIILADTKEEVIDFLKKDVYVEAGVWDVANVSCCLL